MLYVKFGWTRVNWFIFYLCNSECCDISYCFWTFGHVLYLKLFLVNMTLTWKWTWTWLENFLKTELEASWRPDIQVEFTVLKTYLNFEFKHEWKTYVGVWTAFSTLVTQVVGCCTNYELMWLYMKHYSYGLHDKFFYDKHQLNNFFMISFSWTKVSWFIVKLWFV